MIAPWAVLAGHSLLLMAGVGLAVSTLGWFGFVSWHGHLLTPVKAIMGSIMGLTIVAVSLAAIDSYIGAIGMLFLSAGLAFLAAW